MRRIAALLLVLAVLIPVAPAPAGVLSVPVLYQQQEQWCWAASCQMILSYYGYSSSQCAMANWCFYQSTCCNSVVWPDGTGYYCNQPNYIYGYGRGMKEVLIQWGPIYSSGQMSALAWSTVQSESNAGRPFVIGFSWLPIGSGGHAMVGKGYSGSYVYYNDPWPGHGASYALYSWMDYAAGDHDWDESLRLTTSPASASDSAPLQLYAGDFNGDAYSDLAIFRASSGLWSIRGITRAYFGQSGDIPVPADFNGDGTSDIAVFRPSSGLWTVRGRTRFYFGASGDTPIAMHNSGNGLTAAIFRGSSGLWSTRGGNRVYFGRSGDVPLPGPFVSRSGTRGSVNYALFRPSSGLWTVRGTTRFYYGGSADTPVPGDYQSSSSVSTRPWRAAIFRPASGLWSVRGITRAYFGGSGDTPVPADYSGGWGDEMAIFRPASGLWSIRGGNRYYFGNSTDTPATR